MQLDRRQRQPLSLHAGAQEAHKAIRPTDPNRRPEDIRPTHPNRRPEDIRRFLSNDQFRLQELIWRRFVASRMAPAQYANTTAEIQGCDYVFRASGSVLTFDGFYRVWDRSDNEDEEGRLPELNEGETLRFRDLSRSCTAHSRRRATRRQR